MGEGCELKNLQSASMWLPCIDNCSLARVVFALHKGDSFMQVAFYHPGAFGHTLGGHEACDNCTQANVGKFGVGEGCEFKKLQCHSMATMY